MLEKLHQCLLKLPELLDKPEVWDSLIVNRRKPFTYRVFTKIDDLRVCLHKFDVCDTHESFSHPHPWPGAFIILKGKYRMKVGLSPDRFSPSQDVLTEILTKYSTYEITNPLTWHAITPIEPTFTVMCNGDPWDTQTIAHKDVRTTAGKDLDKMPDEELLNHLDIFKVLVKEYLESHE